jgi:hypothetical protein
VNSQSPLHAYFTVISLILGRSVGTTYHIPVALMDDFGYAKSFSPPSEIYLIHFGKLRCMNLRQEISEIFKINLELKFWEGLVVSTLFQMLNPYGGVNRNSTLIIM